MMNTTNAGLTDESRKLGTNHQGLLNTLLLEYAARGDFAAVDALVDEGANADVKTVLGWTALHFAALSGNTVSFRKLVDKGATIDAKTAFGLTALHLASRGGHAEIFEHAIA